MHGMGRAITSSPTSPASGSPVALNANTSAPSARHWSSPLYTGKSGHEHTNAVHKSVPPLTEASSTSLDTLAYTHSKPSGGSGAPVEPTSVSALKSHAARGVMPA